MVLAWHTAALSRARRMPDLESLLDRLKDPAAPQRQSWQQMYAAARQWTAYRRDIAAQKTQPKRKA